MLIPGRYMSLNSNVSVPKNWEVYHFSMLQSWTPPLQTVTFHVHLLEKPATCESCAAAWAQADVSYKGYTLPDPQSSAQLHGMYSHKGISLCLAHICWLAQGLSRHFSLHSPATSPFWFFWLDPSTWVALKWQITLFKSTWGGFAARAAPGTF